MRTLKKIGIIGLSVTIMITTIVFLTTNVSFGMLAPFYMPWLVLLLIGFATKTNNK